MEGIAELNFFIILLILALAALVIVLIASFACFLKVFYLPPRKRKRAEEYPTPDGKIYHPHRAQMVAWIKEIRAMTHTDVSIVSFDGLRLCGKYYEYSKGAPIEIMFHGYKGTAERDLCGGVYRCFELGHSALIVDHRGSGSSEGRVTTFGAKESRDCLAWVDFVINNIDKDARIILTGISMGAATVMIAASMDLPPNVVGVLADCGYTSTKDIIKKVMRDMRLPANIMYPFVKLGARLFGRFDTDGLSPIKSMKKCCLPVIFFHGDTDDYVPYSMSEENYAACVSQHKRLVTIHGAGHGLCFPVDMKTYFDELEAFFAPHL